MDAYINDIYTRELIKRPDVGALALSLRETHQKRLLAEELLEDMLPIPLPRSAEPRDVAVLILQKLLLPHLPL